MTQAWDAARAASKRPQRKYKPVGPVGEKLSYYTAPTGTRGLSTGFVDSEGRGVMDILTCKHCGYHVCSCEPCTGFPQCKSCYPRPCRAKPGGTYELSCGCVCMTAPQFRERWPAAEIRSDSLWFDDGVGPRWAVMRVYHTFAGVRRYCEACERKNSERSEMFAKVREDRMQRGCNAQGGEGG